MAKPRAHGTLVELRALALLYGRDVLLFEPFNTGAWFVTHGDDTDAADTDYSNSVSTTTTSDEDSADARKCLHLFFTSDGHFDTVYHQMYIEDAAFCQSLCYEIMYSYVFSLPDVMYAVERMLHDSPLEMNRSETDIESTAVALAGHRHVASITAASEADVTYSSMYPDGYPERMVLADGRVFLLDRPERTCCVLENYSMCHFHNGRNFEKLSLQLRHDLWNSREPQQEARALRHLQSMLPDRYTSCVRQLLMLGITPFPYKVAKALDPSMYRNVEYDTWSEHRKEQQMRYLQNVGNCLKIGARCYVRLSGSAANAPMVCHIQDIRHGKCFVFVEGLGEKRYVPMSALQCIEGNGERMHHHHNINRNNINGHSQRNIQQQNYLHPYNTQNYRNYSRTFNANNGTTIVNNTHRGQRQLYSAPSTGLTHAIMSTSSQKSIIGTTSASSSSSSAWVHNKFAMGGGGHGWTISNGGRRYGFTKNTCNHNKVAAALAQKHAEQQQQQRRKQQLNLTTSNNSNDGNASTAMFSTNSRSGIFADETADKNNASTACLKMFDDHDVDNHMLDDYQMQDNDDKLLQFVHCNDGNEDDDVDGGKDAVAMQLSHLTSMTHFEPRIFEPIIAAPLVVGAHPGTVNNGGPVTTPTAGNYRSGKQHAFKHNGGSNHGAGGGLGRKKGENR